MNGMKIIVGIAMIFFVAVSSGCGGNLVKGAIKDVGKGVTKTAQKVPKVVKNNAFDIADAAVDLAGGSNTPDNTRPTGSRPPVSKPISKTGAVMAGGAAMAGGSAVVNELMTGALNSKDLSLGSLMIDDRAEKVSRELGKPSSVKTDSDGGERLTFRDAEVVLKQGKVSALVSQSPALATARGIHEGSAVQEVFDKYGTGYNKTSYDGQTLYEYKITSAEGHPCWLRFAIENSGGKVVYISERFVQNETASDNASDAKQTFLNYHRAITDKNYRAAYEILSDEQKKRMGDFNSYENGFENTISSEVISMNLISSDGDSCTFSYTLTARDRAQGNRVKIATFKGEVTMTKDNGHWYVRYAKSDKVNERYE